MLMEPLTVTEQRGATMMELELIEFIPTFDDEDVLVC